MSKMALVTPLKSAPFFIREFAGLTMFGISTHRHLTNLGYHLAPRDTCETDESLLQLLPYMTLRDGDKYFVYSRGGKGEEARLHSLLSIGIGGHVDEMPGPGVSLYCHLQNEAAREFAEEVGETIPNLPEFTGILRDTTNAVGRVHLGLHAMVEYTPNPQAKHEDGVIENGRWLTLRELSAEYYRMENWSKAVLDVLLDAQYTHG